MTTRPPQIGRPRPSARYPGEIDRRAMCPSIVAQSYALSLPSAAESLSRSLGRARPAHCCRCDVRSFHIAHRAATPGRCPMSGDARSCVRLFLARIRLRRGGLVPTIVGRRGAMVGTKPHQVARPAGPPGRTSHPRSNPRMSPHAGLEHSICAGTPRTTCGLAQSDDGQNRPHPTQRKSAVQRDRRRLDHTTVRDLDLVEIPRTAAVSLSST